MPKTCHSGHRLLRFRSRSGTRPMPDVPSAPVIFDFGGFFCDLVRGTRIFLIFAQNRKYRLSRLAVFSCRYFLKRRSVCRNIRHAAAFYALCPRALLPLHGFSAFGAAFAFCLALDGGAKQTRLKLCPPAACSRVVRQPSRSAAAPLYYSGFPSLQGISRLHCAHPLRFTLRLTAPRLN